MPQAAAKKGLIFMEGFAQAPEYIAVAQAPQDVDADLEMWIERRRVLSGG